MSVHREFVRPTQLVIELVGCELEEEATEKGETKTKLEEHALEPSDRAAGEADLGGDHLEPFVVVGAVFGGEKAESGFDMAPDVPAAGGMSRREPALAGEGGDGVGKFDGLMGEPTPEETRV